MLIWFDGHMLLFAILVVPVSFLVVLFENERRARKEARDEARAALRQAFFASRGVRR